MAANSRKRKKKLHFKSLLIKTNTMKSSFKKIKPESHQGFRGNFQFLENIKLLGRSERNMLGKFQELIIVEDHHKVHYVAFLL